MRSLASHGQDLFTVIEAQQELEADAPYAAIILHRLAAKGWLQRIARGRYRIVPLEAGPDMQWAEHEFRIAATLKAPYYLAYATALAYYGYTEHALNPIWIATTRKHRPLSVDGVTYRFVILAAHKFFGYTHIEIMETPIAMAEREKALADGFDHPEYCGGVIEAAKGLWYGRDEIDLERVVAYTYRLRNRSALKRLGFWSDRLDIAPHEMLERLTQSDRNYPLLDPGGSREGRRDTRWRLIVNIPEEQLLEWREN